MRRRGEPPGCSQAPAALLGRTMRGISRRTFLGSLGTAAVACPGSVPRAQSNYPAGLAIRFIVPFPPGGSVDFVARIVADRLGALWKVPTVVENVPGAGGNIGIDRVAKGPVDGTQ